MSATRVLLMDLRRAKEFEDHRPGYQAGVLYQRQQRRRYAIGSASDPNGSYDIFNPGGGARSSNRDASMRQVGRRDWDVFGGG
jgi:hypothetical protein